MAKSLAVMFTAGWCPFCRMFTPTFDSVAKEKGMEHAYVDLSNWNNPLWEVFDIQVVPTIVVFKEGRPIFRKDGLLGRGLPKQAMEEVVAATLT